MKKCLIIPDSFKGTMTSGEICQIIKEKVLRYYPDCRVIAVPVADGGEGTVDCFVYAADYQKIPLQVSGPYGEIINCYYGRKDDIAIIEMAQAAGLPLVGSRPDPSRTTTFGVGMMIRDAVEKGCRKIILGLGGSCTNDAATGLAAAVGVKFFNEDGQSFIPVGRNLQEIKDLDLSSAQELLQDCQITAICDIDNPMYGQKGAAYVFAPQKGADKQMVKLLDDNLHYLADLLIEKLAIDVADLPGAGAAGAMGAGIAAFLGGSLQSGIETILDTIDFDDLAEGADLIFTGEGKIDGQSLRGKVVIGIAQRAIKKHIPVIALVGDIGDDAEAAYQMGVTAIFSINQQAIPFSEARLRSKRDLASTVDSLLRYWQIAYK